MDKNQRILLFVFACLLVRLVLAGVATYIAYEAEEYEYVMAIVYFIFGLAFVVRYFLYVPGSVGLFKGIVWWNELRLTHATFYIVYSILVIFHVPYSWVNLFVSVLVGICAFTHHYINNV